jgi:hypothetical protein
MEFMSFLSCYRSDDEEEEKQQKQYCVLKPHYVKEIGKFWELKDDELQNVLIMVTSDQQKIQSAVNTTTSVSLVSGFF